MTKQMVELKCLSCDVLLRSTQKNLERHVRSAKHKRNVEKKVLQMKRVGDAQE